MPEAPPAATPVAPTLTLGGPKSRGFDHANTWDLNIDGAFGRFFGSEEAKWTGFGRIRGGALFIRDSLYSAIGATYEYSSLEKGTFGVQAELMHIEMGLWGQAGALLDVSGHPGAMAAVGWSLFGVEAQVRSYDGLGTGVGLYVKLRIPVSIIARVFARHPGPPPEPPTAAKSP